MGIHTKKGGSQKLFVLGLAVLVILVIIVKGVSPRLLPLVSLATTYLDLHLVLLSLAFAN